MNRAFNRVCLLLAAAGFSEREVREFANCLIEDGPGTLLHQFTYVRDMLRGIHLEQLETTLEHTAVTQTSAGTLSKVERLLLDEAGLSKGAAVDLLMIEFRKRYPTKRLPSESRKGFAAWIEKLSVVIPESELLHVATQIRNSFVHQTPSDWRLK